MDYNKYLIKKGKLDLLSSLKALDKKLLDEKLREYGARDVYELKEYILEIFKSSLEDSKEDIYTQLFFMRLLENENSECISAYRQDIEELMVFVYENDDYLSYYIPTEIKKIIKDMLKEMNSEEQINLQNAADTPIIKDLKGLLEALTVQDLRSIGQLFHINRLSKIRKKELVTLIYNTLTDENKLSQIIEEFIDKEFNLLKELMANEGTIQNNKISIEQYHFLYITGLVFLFKRGNRFYISMTDDVYKAMQKINLNKFNKIIDENTKAYNLVRAMVELYGVVSYSDLLSAYNEYYAHNDEELDVSLNALYFCERFDNIAHINFKHCSYFINKILYNGQFGQLFMDIAQRQMDIKRKPIKLEELLKYTDFDYYENNASKDKLKKYLKTKNIDEEEIEEIILSISKMYRIDHSFIGMSIEMLQDYELEITEQNIQEITSYLMDIYNNTRLWINHGWTPIEMREEFEEKH